MNNNGGDFAFVKALERLKPLFPAAESTGSDNMATGLPMDSCLEKARSKIGTK